MLGGFIFFQSFNIAVISVVCAVLISAFLLSFFNPFGKFLKGWFGRSVIVIALISFLLSYLYFDLFFYASKRFEEKEVTAHGVITYMETGGITEIDIEVSDIDSKPFSEYKIKAYIDYDKYYNISEGTEIKIKGKIEDFDFGDGSFDTNTYYTSLGYSGVMTEISELTIISEGNFSPEYLINSYRSSITRNIVLNTNSEVGGLLSAILLGDKTYLSGQTRLDFSRIGISHVLALSGMHLAILILGIEKLLEIFGVRKRARYVSTIFLTLFYMILTGLPLSVVRAGVMLIIRSLLHLFSKTHDSQTSLSISVFIICLVEPYAVFSTSLWLSAFATFGILVYSEYESKRRKEEGKKPSLFTKLKDALMISVFAIAATLLFTAVAFDGVSVFGAFSTLIFSFLVEIFLYIGMFVPLVGSFLPIGKLVIPVGEFIASLAGEMSDFKYSYVSSDFVASEILIAITSGIFIAFSVLKIKQKATCVIILSSMLAAFFFTSLILTYTVQNETRLAYERYKSQEIIKVSNEDNIGIVDVSSYDKNTGFEVLSSLSDDNLTRIDKYIMMRYSYNTKEAIKLLCDRVKVDKIYLPRPVSEDEELIFKETERALKGYRTLLMEFRSEDMIDVGTVSVMPIYSGLLEEDNTSILFSLFYKDKAYTYTTLPMLEGKHGNYAKKIISDSETVILGSHGYVKEYKFNLKLENAESIIFASDKIFVHSTVCDYYKDKKLYTLPDKVNLISSPES